ncbi:protein-export membrane protein SecF [Orientia tsutsugamushi str. Gilliam]|uniref:Protein-export membrane protein SecF n=2 Tax=Orientia tsutsugamushi TaxID=784 RepID=A0A0F3MAJ5_ORITS|nr:protein translocase subunit SecF [Orientia tsutsugamushi]KJV51604.1 protein-export membrane protein SecF [Orientia tsutsugamushi str. Gilliam]SPR08608.1 protein translocase subunit SecF [Orientia tsutsugamushi str. Gilliam]
MPVLPLELILSKINVDFVRLRKLNYIVSILLIIFSIASLLIFKLNLSTSFIGGINLEIKISPLQPLGSIRSALNNADLGKLSIHNFGAEDVFSIKIANKSQDNNSIGLITNKVKSILETQLNCKVTLRKTSFIGPQVSSYLVKSSIKALALALVGIAIYVWIRFKWQFGIGILVAIMHDAILSLGFMSISGLEFDLSSVAALLTVIGYSVNDSVIIYDRIRENMNKNNSSSKPIEDIINISISATLSRTILTVFTTLLANLALILFGGAAIKSFSILVFIGIIVGTYSSIFVSAPILMLFNIQHQKKR